VRSFGGIVAIVAIIAAAAFALHLDGSSTRGGNASTGDRPGTMVDDAAVDEGQALYLQSCASCHGPAAQGTARGPALTDVGLASWDFMLRTGRMPAAAPDEAEQPREPPLSEEQIASLLAFAATIVEAGPEIPRVVVDAALLPEGWETYIQDCAACHAATGAGDAVGAGFIAPSLLEADPRTVAEAVLIGPGAMPAFPFLEDRLDALATYVDHLQRTPPRGGISLGGLGPVAEGFVAVVLGLGILVLITRWVARPAR
jgi:ubiquinol-cytochrome c reductase cytochrome c subunit